jgi:hypothetical protein
MWRNANLVGCVAILLAAVTVAWGQAQTPAQDEPESSSYAAARRGTATVDDAYRVFLTMASNHGRVELKREVEDLSFEEVSAQLEALCIVDPDWSYSPETCLRRDVLAYMCCSHLGYRPGVLTGAFGMTRRYAHREMLYRRIIPPGTPGTLVSGSELLSVATRVSRRVDPKRDVQLKDSQIH